MAVKAPQGWYDISVPLKQGMISLPIDPVPPKIYRFSDVDLGSKVTMSMLEIISHTGTHIDTPRHFIPGGSTVSDMPLDATVGPARVIGTSIRCSTPMGTFSTRGGSPSRRIVRFAEPPGCATPRSSTATRKVTVLPTMP